MLELDAVKVACPVLRGLGGSDATWLPGGTIEANVIKIGGMKDAV